MQAVCELRDLLLNWLPYWGSRTQSAQQDTHIAGWERRDGFMPFPRALTQNKMQTALSRVWTLVNDSIWYETSYYDQNFKNGSITLRIFAIYID